MNDKPKPHAASCHCGAVQFRVQLTEAFNTKTAKHFFCSVCGIYTHHQRRSNPTQFGINVSCLEGVSPFGFEEVGMNDGVNHPSDAASGPLIAGVLRFSPT